MKRRELLLATALAAGVSGCANLREAVDPRSKKKHVVVPTDEATRLLNRAAFGPNIADSARLAALGPNAWLDEQLSAPLDDDDEEFGLRYRLHSTADLFTENPAELRDLPQSIVLEKLQRAAILRSAYSKWQLRERMAEFWSDHLNIYARKVFTAPNRDKASAELMYFQGQAIQTVVRANALGTVRGLIGASMKSPAMLGYLDQQVSDARHPNENYARELLELHTLGVGSGYTQKDVMEVARCLTGWTIEDRVLNDLFSGSKHAAGSVYFDPSRHDNGEKLVLGTTVAPNGGANDADLVLDILLQQPAMARFIAKKLVKYFYGEDENSPTLIERVAAAFGADGDIKGMLRALFTAPEFAKAPPVVKRPFDFLISSVRVTGALCDGSEGIQYHLGQMGQSLYQWPMPDGYPSRTNAWTGSLLARWNFAVALLSGGIKGSQVELESAGALIPHTVAFEGKPWERIALALCAPEFQWR